MAVDRTECGYAYCASGGAKFTPYVRGKHSDEAVDQWLAGAERAGREAYEAGKDLETEAAKIEDLETRVAFRKGYPDGGLVPAQEQIAETLEITPEKLPNGNIDGVKKYDAGKAPVMRGCVQRFPLAIQQVSLVSEYGCRKYGTFDGWETLPDAQGRYTDALGRHLLLAKSEGPYDAGDSGLPHLAQVAWNALATLELALRNGVVEMTRGNDIGEDGKPILNSNGVSK